jgi:hypothetical protein
LFCDTNNVDVMIARFQGQVARKQCARNEKGSGHLLLVRKAICQQLPGFYVRWVPNLDGNKHRSEDETTICVHESYAIEVSFIPSVNRRIVHPEGDPRFVDLELVWMKYRASHFVKPSNV